jgi:L-ascorbate metabolism protein UlaG (beta-lactamase superfamily)
MIGLHLIYCGTNTLVVKKGQSTLFIDPHFTRPSLWSLFGKIQPDPEKIKIGINGPRIGRLDGVLLTHAHYDHALDASEVVRQSGGIIYGSRSAVNLAKGAGLGEDQYQTVNPGEFINVGTFSVNFHPGRHIKLPTSLRWFLPEAGEITQPLSPPAWFWQYQCGEVYAIQVDHLLVFGSAGFTPGAYAGLDIKTVILAIGGLETKTRAYLEELYQETVLSTGAQQVLLSHWDNFFRYPHHGINPLGLADRTVDRLKGLGLQYGQSVRTLPYGEALMI